MANGNHRQPLYSSLWNCQTIETMAISLCFLCVVVIARIHLSATATPPQSLDSYLYKTTDSFPVLEHGHDGADFTKSQSPRVVEFYDPKCGVCQAFKSNYVEVAKKVKLERPHVEFYGVSCSVHKDLCAAHGARTVPKIVVFPDSELVGGKEVAKGSGTIHFLSQRLIKALRSKEEVEADALNHFEGSRRRGLMSDYGTEYVTDDSTDDGEKFEYEEFSRFGKHQYSPEEDLEDRSELPGSNDDGEVELDHDGPDNYEIEKVQLDTAEAEAGYQMNSFTSNREVHAESRDEDDEVIEEDPDHVDVEYGFELPLPNTVDADIKSKDPYNREKMHHLRDESQRQLNDDKIPREEQRFAPESIYDTPIHETDAYKNTMREIEAGLVTEAHINNMNEVGLKTEQKPVDERGMGVSRMKVKTVEVGGERGEKNVREQKQPLSAELNDSIAEKGASKNQKSITLSTQTVELNEPPSHEASIRNSQNVRESPHDNRLRDSSQRQKIPPPPPRKVLPVNGDASDLNSVAPDVEQIKKLQEYIARKKSNYIRREKLKHPIDTVLGRNKAVSEEEISSNKQKQLPIDTKKAMNIKAEESTRKPAKKVPDLRPEGQEKKLAEKVLAKVPIVKRAYRRSKGEETLNDAALSFTRGLLMGVFKTNNPLDHKRRVALVNWFDLMSVSLPPEMGLHELIDTLRYNIDSISLSIDNLATIIEKHHIPNPKWSDSCSRKMKGSGFFCGFWKLLHIMSVGFAEQAGGLSLKESNPSTRTFSTKEAGDIFREYMAYFFNCDKCVKRFIGRYDDCSFNRCIRLTSETGDATSESWWEFPLYIWEYHNDVSRSKAIRAATGFEKVGKRAEAKKLESDMRAIFPHVDQCISCYTSEGTWNEHAVYLFLEKEYWTFGHDVTSKMERMLDFRGNERNNVSFGLNLYFLLSLLLVVGWVVKRQKLRMTGWHKKNDVSVFMRLPKSRGGVKFRDS